MTPSESLSIRDTARRERCQERPDHAQTIERNRGRWERRRFTVNPEIGDYIAPVHDWHNATQAYYLQRETTRHGQTRRQVEVGLTSLDATTGSPEALFRLRRQHWHIENRNHRVRDVTYDEDRSQVRWELRPASWRQ